ncbi:MAG: hypothetical protein CM15mP87_02850 [Candidatus Neomarinimicrobiota bacterium]|nr:MAG: hypothetical protein CM15mP87_02850 [Candidatus Neomarinimicrobiota bacterium]
MAKQRWKAAGFHIATLPINAGAHGRFPAMEVKLKGVIAKTNPSSGRYSREFLTPSGEKKRLIIMNIFSV